MSLFSMVDNTLDCLLGLCTMPIQLPSHKYYFTLYANPEDTVSDTMLDAEHLTFYSMHDITVAYQCWYDAWRVHSFPT